MDYKFIVIEGVDGTGKTSAASQLAQHINARYVLTPMPPIEGIVVDSSPTGRTSLTRYINELNDVDVRFCYYLLASAHASHQIKRLLKSTHVVCDRYIFSTLAYHRALDPKFSRFNDDWLTILQPDHAFLLTVSDRTEWHKRLRTKAPHQRSDEYLEQNVDLLIRVENEYKQLGLEEIDTSRLTVEAVVQTLISKINNMSEPFKLT